jgi:MoxR-like ATPase
LEPSRARLGGIIEHLERGLVERGCAVRLTLLGALAGEHTLLVGPPGTAKSELARRVHRAFRDARYFERLLTRFTVPEELFGPLSIRALEEDRYERHTAGFLPEASIAFIDEVFKANSAILNSLLTLVNERVFHHGRHRDAVPLIGLVGASNELPAEEGLAALFDRFLVRLSVPPLGETASFLAVATGTVPEPEIPAGEALTAADRAAIRDAARRVRVPDVVADALVALWQEGSRREWGVSDRRWRQAVHLLKVAAATAGRDAVEPLDLLLLEPILAPTPERAGEVRDLLVAGLGARSVPEHDLRAQWLLLGRGDRVAPAAGEPEAPPAGPHWSARLARRRAAVGRFLAHHREAVARLAADRRALERRAEAHPWIAALPSRVLAAHVQAARDLVGILEVAEAYAADLDGPAAVARALLHRLPERPRRYYGTDVACVLSIPDAGVRYGLTLAGERLALEGADPDAIEIAVPAERFLAWVDGEAEADLLRGGAPGQRAAATALDSARRLLGRQVIPRPPELPPYSGLSA